MRTRLEKDIMLSVCMLSTSVHTQHAANQVDCNRTCTQYVVSGHAIVTKARATSICASALAVFAVLPNINSSGQALYKDNVFSRLKL